MTLMVREIVGTMYGERVPSALSRGDLSLFGGARWGVLLRIEERDRICSSKGRKTAGKGDVGIGRHASCELWGVGSLKDPLERPSYANYAGMMC